MRRLARRVPLIMVGHGSTRLGCDVVRSDGDLGIALAVDHLAGLGHEQITYINGLDMPGGSHRVHGYTTAMARHGLTLDILDFAGDYTEEAGARAAQVLLERPNLPTAVVANNDHAALGLVTSFLRQGVSVPGDVSITGYDDSRLAGLSFIDLTSVRQDSVQIGDLTIDCAISRISGERQRAMERISPTTLIIRSSTAAPREVVSRPKKRRPARTS